VRKRTLCQTPRRINHSSEISVTIFFKERLAEIAQVTGTRDKECLLI